ncbi:TIGR00645 family protein [Halothiobacillus sp.]|jgi:uncharacterized protein (TIGR00645 family)|uniref:TIGR00645 family protein n=1 Tax=Halothiobacillus sp. TaxID=1891311 RepID=UPI0026326795|nr:TIGR00645 family protein [Halothiobacillus sp.]MDD3576149.1 TIGR00645 family protein [Halothiobacillus sp.]MDD4966781.1 TIGR00645 family protein [Halothiobacillus sp.]MDY0147974.1 TIGR00645 family protein [Halothiobacillus sp.]
MSNDSVAKPRSAVKHFESGFEHFLFASRWLMAPIYLGLVVAMGVLLMKFGKETWHLVSHVSTMDEGQVIVGVLTLVDVSLLMNLLIIIMFSGYENFVSKMEDLHAHADRPDWMGSIGFSDLKIKLIGSMVAISGIELLKAFMNVDTLADRHLAWLVGIHVTFLFSGLIFAIMEKLQSGQH